MTQKQIIPIFALSVAVVVLFGAPTLLACNPHLLNAEGWFTTFLVILAATSYIMLWFLANDVAFVAALNLYGRQTQPIGFVLTARIVPGISFSVTKKLTLICAGLGYITTIYGFALTYLLIQHLGWGLFDKPISGIIAAIYFSVVTIATVGFGDITPQDEVSRLLVSAEIMIGVAYSIFFFSIIATFIRDPANPTTR